MLVLQQYNFSLLTFLRQVKILQFVLHNNFNIGNFSLEIAFNW